MTRSDAWRERNPDKKAYTSFQLRGGDSGPGPSRVDLALVPRRLKAAVERIEVLDTAGTFTTKLVVEQREYTKALRSDHVPILLEMCLR